MINNLYYFILYMRWSIEDFVYGGTDGVIITFKTGTESVNTLTTIMHT